MADLFNMARNKGLSLSGMRLCLTSLGIQLGTDYLSGEQGLSCAVTLKDSRSVNNLHGYLSSMDSYLSKSGHILQ